MKLYLTTKGILLEYQNRFYDYHLHNWDQCINREKLHQKLLSEIASLAISDISKHQLEKELQPPIVSQEVWAAGVTYFRSREARMEESQQAGGADFYDKVYDAERPEIFFKATARRCVGSGGMVHIRKDSTWDVPEPELTLFICSAGTIEGYTIGNDMSSRSIEGENPLYLPQAKVYDRCAGLGPGLYVPPEPLPSHSQIHLKITRNAALMVDRSIRIDQMKRGHRELAQCLFDENSFPHGVYLMTGTGIVPESDFSLAVHDEIRISIDSIGTLINFVGQRN